MGPVLVGRQLVGLMVEPLVERRLVGTELVEPDLVSMVGSVLHPRLGNLVTA